MKTWKLSVSYLFVPVFIGLTYIVNGAEFIGNVLKSVGSLMVLTLGVFLLVFVYHLPRFPSGKLEGSPYNPFAVLDAD